MSSKFATFFNKKVQRKEVKIEGFFFFPFYYILQVKTYILFIIFSFYGITNFSQSRELDSIYNSIPSINNKQDFLKFIDFHKKVYASKNISVSIYKKIYTKALNWSLKSRNENLQLKTKFYLTQFYFKIGDFQNLLPLSLELLHNKNFLKLKESVNEVDILIEYYKQTEQFKEMISIFPLRDSLLVKHKLNLYKVSDDFKNQEIGLIYYKLRDYNKSRLFFKKSEYAYRKKKRYLQTSSQQNNIGLTFLRENKLDSANFYFNKSLFYLKKVDDIKPVKSSFKAVILANKASILEKKKQYDKALVFYLTELKENSKKNKDYPTIRSAYLKIARVLFIKKKINLALQYLDSTELILKKYPHNLIHQDYLDLKGKCYLVKGNIEKANQIYNQLKQYKDSIEKTNNKQRNLNAVVKFEVQKKEKELQLNKQKIEAQKAKNTILFLSLLFLSLLVLFLFYALRKNIKAKQLFLVQKEKLQRSLEEKNILLKETHHRVKNNLQIISSILDLQHIKSKNPELNNLLQQARNRIQSMALVHQQLYQSNDLAEIPLEKYLEKLINYLSSIIPNKKIIFNINSNNNKLNVNTTIPLGLIVNELITNSYKHGFKNCNQGIINIEIKKIDSNTFELIYSDNGLGLPKDFNIEKIDSLGIKLIKILAKQLNGELHIYPKATFRIVFKDDSVS